MHAAAWRRGRRGVGPVHRSGAETVSFCAFSSRSYLLEELFPIVASDCVPVNAKSAKHKGPGFLEAPEVSRSGYSSTFRRRGSAPL